MNNFIPRYAILSTRAAASTVAIALCALGGCSTTGGRVERAPAVQSTDVTRIPEKMQSSVMNFPTGDSSSSVLRVEQISPREVRADSEYAYQVRVVNLTAKPLNDVVLRASKPEGLRLAEMPEGGPAAKPDANGWLTYNVGNLGPHETRVFRMSGTPTGTGAIRQTYDVKFEQKMETAVSVTAPAVAVAKEGPREADVCQEINWNYAVRNTGTGVARNVVLRDPLPPGLTTADGKNVVAADLGDIPAGETRRTAARLRAAHAGQYASAATVTSDVGEAKSESVTTVAREPVLDLAVKGPAKADLGKPVTYEVTVKNTGDTTAQKVVLNFDATENGTLVGVTDAAGAQLAAAAGPGRSLGSIDAGQSKTFSVTFEAPRGGTLRMGATVSGNCAAKVARTADTEIMTVAALLLEAVDVQDPVKIGENVVYKIKVTNQGNGPDTNIQVRAMLPEGEEYVKASGVSEATAQGQAITFAAVQTLAAKQSATWEITAKAARAGDVQFKVSATSDSVKAAAEKTEPTKLY